MRENESNTPLRAQLIVRAHKWQPSTAWSPLDGNFSILRTLVRSSEVTERAELIYSWPWRRQPFFHSAISLFSVPFLNQGLCTRSSLPELSPPRPTPQVIKGLTQPSFRFLPKCILLNEPPLTAPCLKSQTPSPETLVSSLFLPSGFHFPSFQLPTVNHCKQITWKIP